MGMAASVGSSGGPGAGGSAVRRKNSLPHGIDQHSGDGVASRQQLVTELHEVGLRQRLVARALVSLTSLLVGAGATAAHILANVLAQLQTQTLTRQGMVLAGLLVESRDAGHTLAG